MGKFWNVLWMLLAGCSVARGAAPAEERPQLTRRSFTKPSDDVIKRTLSAGAFQVTQQQGTEPPFKNAFWDNHAPGIYVDVVTGEPLFGSMDKFESGTGWPSFTRPLEKGRVVAAQDISHGMVRSEVHSAAGATHLGHVFDDGPAPTGLRYCINSASLKFIAEADLEKAGYGEYRTLFAAAPVKQEVALLAGGCFWGMQELLRSIPGVITTEVGYTGGTTASPTYDDLHDGTTGHAESVKVVFDPSKLSYASLLENWFFKMHDPTTPNRQGNDRGSQYRSAIFFTSPEQERVALEVKARVEKGGHWKKPVVTQITAAGAFTRAEENHQDYLQKHPDGYTCHYMRE